MDQQTVPVARSKKQKPARWESQAKGGIRPETLREIRRIAAEMIAPFLLGFSEVMGVPSGLQAAYMGAVAVRGESLLWPLCGCLLSLGMRALWGLTVPWTVLISWGLMLWGPRVLFRQRVERLMLYTGIALLPGFILALVEGQPEAVILGAASVLMGVFSAPVFLRALIAWKTPGMITQTEDTVSVCFLVAMLLGGGSRLSLFGLQVGMVGAAFLTVGAGFYLGSGAGTLMGMLGGISMAAQGYPMDLAVALGAGGFLAGLTRRRECAPLSAFAFAVGCGTVLLFSGRLRAGWITGGLLGTAALALYPPVGRKWLGDTFRRLGNVRRLAEDQYAALWLTRWEHTMEEMASQVPMPWADKPPHDTAWWRGRLCAGCPLEGECRCLEDQRSLDKAEEVWARRGEDEQSFLQAMEGLRGMGCARLYLMRERMAALRREDSLRQAALHRASYEREMVRTHLLAASGAAKALAEISTGEDWWEAVMIRRVQSALGERSFPAELLFARRLRGRACLGFREVATLPLGKVEEQLRQLMEEEVGLRLEPARREEGVLVFDELAPWRVEGGWAARALEEDTEMMGNGDAVLMCRLPDGRFLGALSDGMGHGLHAHMESTRTLELLRLCLQAGYTVEQTLTAVNGMMLSANQGEEYATVDLLVLDPWLGRAELHKLGACYSVLVCGGRETLLEGAALPLGILEEVEPLSTSFHLEDGQQLFLMSDGITDVLEESELRAACLRSVGETTAEDAAAALLQCALNAVGDSLHDDASCAVIRVSHRKKEDKRKKKTEAPDGDALS